MICTCALGLRHHYCVLDRGRCVVEHLFPSQGTTHEAALNTTISPVRLSESERPDVLLSTLMEPCFTNTLSVFQRPEQTPAEVRRCSDDTVRTSSVRPCQPLVSSFKTCMVGVQISSCCLSSCRDQYAHSLLVTSRDVLRFNLLVGCLA